MGWTARAQPWLGTLVEIALPASAASDGRFAAAFTAIAHVHRTMSAHATDSDLARIARTAHRCAVVVDAQTYAVLEQAQALFRETSGAFDVTIAPALARYGVLPRYAAPRGTQCGTMAALHLESELDAAPDARYRVRCDRPVALDLGGIAKGFAVDRAIAALRASGAIAGVVNAGGDMRAFGKGYWMPVRVRHPATPTLALPLFDVSDAAVATSADYFRDGRGALVAPGTHAVQAITGAITVVAPTCMLADALTKVVALLPAQAPEILARHGAAAFCLDMGKDGLRCMTTSAETPPYLRLPSPLHLPSPSTPRRPSPNRLLRLPTSAAA